MELDPGALAWILLAEGLYLRALRVLGRRGVDVPGKQIAIWHLGIALWAGGLLSPIHTVAEQLLCFHMGEHLMIADLAAPLLLAGARNPVLMFLLPKGILVSLARRRRLRVAFRFLRTPLVAAPLYIVVMVGWHLNAAFEAATAHAGWHALQHACFIGAGMLLWWPILEPKRRRLRPELWKIGYFLGTRMVTMVIGMDFVFIRHPLYTGVYGAGTRKFGLSPIDDQQIGGGLMTTVDVYLMVFVLSMLFYRAAQQSAREEEAERAALAT